ncbi:hypothetical protein N658DRAFT_496596 [Parathielavia hyrcaniae]|uniref:Uncharacterized protein n=1 Tax=Parathielavia hyrcaniae TaxID=113614 RepID=A0AAN6Q5D5_9PEZI|nr:hypothetical protein N658DRAFT_496596 [Parathielavia hyrcaniae]
MASAVLPGTYPDSVPPTPDETMQQQHQTDQPSGQPNTLHKPGDFRGHNYTDSGVGMVDQDILRLHRNQPDDPEDHGGLYRRDDHQPMAAFETSRTEPDTYTQAPAETEGNTQVYNNDLELAAGAAPSYADSETSSNYTEMTPKPSPKIQNTSAPYWGDLPKGVDGGVYNTVTGHGSSADDHDKRHQPEVPAKSPARRSPDYSPARRFFLPAHVPDYSWGSGVYNSVVGHGSQDEESRRHSQHRSADDSSHLTAIDTNRADDNKFAAPLPDIPEERQKPSQPVAFHDPHDSQAASGHILETAVRDDVRLMEAASNDPGRTRVPPKSTTTQPQRAFPLAAASTEHGHHEQWESTSPSRYGAGVGVAGLAAGPAAHEYFAGRNRTSGFPRVGDSHQAEGVAASGPVQTSPVTDTRDYEAREESPKGEKKHRILGLFHRHKDDGYYHESERPRRRSVGDNVGPAGGYTARQPSPNRLRKLTKSDTASERRRSRSSSLVDNHDQPSHGKDNKTAAAAGAAALLNRRHHKFNSINESQQEPDSPARGKLPAGRSCVDNYEEPSHGKDNKTAAAAGAAAVLNRHHHRNSVHETHQQPDSPVRGQLPAGTDQSSYGTENKTAAAAGAAAVLNRLHHKNNSINERHQEQGNPVRGQFAPDAGEAEYAEPASHDFQEISTPFEHPREPPIPPHDEFTSHDIDVAGQRGDYNFLTDGTPSGVRRAGDYNEQASSGTAAPSSTGKKHMFARQAGAHPPPKSFGASAMDNNKPRRSSTGIVTQEPGNYNTLPSGTASGIKHPSVPSNATATNPSKTRHRSSSPGLAAKPSLEYNVLPSGTPSGVKIKHKSSRSRSAQAADRVPHADRHKHHHHDHHDHHHHHQSGHEQYAHDNSNALAAGGTAYHDVAGNRNSDTPSYYYRQPEFQQMAQQKSPEVMPVTYTRTILQPSYAEGYRPSRGRESWSGTTGNERDLSGQNDDAYHQYPASRHVAQGMSPEVMPTAYTSPVHAPSQAAQFGHRGQGVRGQGTGMGVGRVVHSCQHCGGENDISEYVERAVRFY